MEPVSATVPDSLLIEMKCGGDPACKLAQSYNWKGLYSVLRPPAEFEVRVVVKVMTYPFAVVGPIVEGLFNYVAPSSGAMQYLALINMSPPDAGRAGAFNQAKRDEGIPVSQQPTTVGPNLDKRGNIQPGRSYTFTVNGEKVLIRDDAGGHVYGPGNTQNRGPHFNTPNGNHYDY